MSGICESQCLRLYTCNIPSEPAYGVFISQLIPHARACRIYTDFLYHAKILTSRLLENRFMLLHDWSHHYRSFMVVLMTKDTLEKREEAISVFIFKYSHKNDILSLNAPHFMDFLHLVYLNKLCIKGAESLLCALYLYLLHKQSITDNKQKFIPQIWLKI